MPGNPLYPQRFAGVTSCLGIWILPRSIVDFPVGIPVYAKQNNEPAATVDMPAGKKAVAEIKPRRLTGDQQLTMRGVLQVAAPEHVIAELEVFPVGGLLIQRDD